MNSRPSARNSKRPTRRPPWPNPTHIAATSISDKHWVTDPQGIAWEAFHTLDTIPMYGSEGAGPAGSRRLRLLAVHGVACARRCRKCHAQLLLTAARRGCARSCLQRAVPVHRQLGAQHHGRVDPQQRGRGPFQRVQRGQPSDGQRESARAGTSAVDAHAHRRASRASRGSSSRKTDAPQLDFVITVCDNAAGEVCPVWPGQPMTAHWGVPDPAAVTGSDAQRRKAFSDASHVLLNRIRIFASLPLAKLDRLSLQKKLDDIGSQRNERRRAVRRRE